MGIPSELVRTRHAPIAFALVLGRLVVGCTMIALCAGCTPTVFRLEPYRDDPVQAQTLEYRASELCCRRRGPTDLPPHHFTTDGCSAWPDGSWVNCCAEHDIAYWCGGSCEDREQADETLRQCVADNGPVGMGTVMYVGVRVGALPWYPFPFRWGYGWDWPRSYDHLHPERIDCPPNEGSGSNDAAHVQQ